MLLSLSGISKQIYYYEDKHFNDKDNKDAFYEKMIIRIFKKNYSKYGIPRITIALNKELDKLGYPKINHKRVERLMNKLNLKARPKKRRYVSYLGTVGKIAPNLLDRNFKTSYPFEKLGTDITVFIMPFGRIYLSPIIDFHTREVVAYDISENPDFKQIIRMFKMLKEKHPLNYQNSILHSDWIRIQALNNYKNFC
ncbi:MAG: IS3 family transposase, partial [Bacilli bacterium]|nr:IS3 family transposase [Bacilli bacterium]